MIRKLAFLACALAVVACPAAADPDGPVLVRAGYFCVVPPGIPCPSTTWEVGVEFDEDIDPVTGADPANYLFHPVGDPDAVIPVAEVEGVWGDHVLLLLTAQPANQDHLLTVSGVEDLDGNLMVPQSFVVEPLANPDTVPDLVAPVLLPAAPNPFNPATGIGFVLPEAGPVELAAFDLAGRRVATLVRATLAAGPHELRWSADGLASGSYLLRLWTPTGTATQAVTLVR